MATKGQMMSDNVGTDEAWAEAGWTSVARGLGISSFLRQVVLVVTVLVGLGLFGLIVGALTATEQRDRVALLLGALGGFFFWSMFLGVLYAVATLLEVQTYALANALTDDD
jgi:hypothetical protein